MGNQLDKAFQEDEYEVSLRIRKISRGDQTQNKRQPERQQQEQTQTQQVEQQREEEQQQGPEEQEVHDEQQQDDQQQENEEQHRQQNQNRNEQGEDQQAIAGTEERREVRTEEMQVSQQRVTEEHEQSQGQHGVQKPNQGYEQAPANAGAAAGATETITFWSNGSANTAFVTDPALLAAHTAAVNMANMANGFGSPYTPPATRTSPRKSNLAAFNSTSFKRSAATTIGRTRRASSIYFNAGSNPSVHIRLLKSHLGPWFSLVIPMDFARYHLLEGRLYEIVDGQVTKYLQVEPERHGTYKLNRKLWKHFAREHNLRVGDSIRIEIVGHDQIKVHVFKRCLDLIPYQPTPVVLPKPEAS